MSSCANCGKSIRTDAGMAFHLSWCRPAEPSDPTDERPVELREYEFRPGEFHRFVAWGRSPEDAIRQIRSAHPDVTIDESTLALVDWQGRPQACLNVGPETVKAAHEPRALPKTPKPAEPKLPKTGTGKHAHCASHVAIVRNAPGVSFACFDHVPSADEVEERRAWMRDLDASWQAMHAREMARVGADVTAPARELALQVAQRPSVYASTLERTDAKTLEDYAIGLGRAFGQREVSRYPWALATEYGAMTAEAEAPALAA